MTSESSLYFAQNSGAKAHALQTLREITSARQARQRLECVRFSAAFAGDLKGSITRHDRCSRAFQLERTSSRANRKRFDKPTDSQSVHQPTHPYGELHRKRKNFIGNVAVFVNGDVAPVTSTYGPMTLVALCRMPSVQSRTTTTLVWM